MRPEESRWVPVAVPCEPLVISLPVNRPDASGNWVLLMDPAVLLSSTEAVQREAVAILKQFGSGSGHVFNLGHGISQFTPPEHVSALIEAVRGFGARND